jgi:hypothetical protein
MRHKKRAQSRWELKIFIALFSASVIGYFAYIVTYGVNVVFWDDWAWAAFLRHGQSTLASLWTQHNESITFVPNALAYVLIKATAWNALAFFWISGVLLLGVLCLITRVFWDEIKRAPLVWLPLPLIVLTLAQYQNTLWAFQIAWFMSLLCIVGAMFLLGRPTVTTWHLLGAALIGVVGSFSLLQGLLVWPAGLIILSSKGQSNRLRALWSAISVLAIGGYFADYRFADTGSASLSYVLAHLSVVLQGLLLTAGSVIPSLTSDSSTIYSPVVSMVVGGLLWLAGLAVIANWLIQMRPSGPKAFCVALIVTSLLFDLLLVPSRLAFDMYSGAASRYDTFMWPLLLGTYAYLMMSRPPRLSRWKHWVRAPQMAISLTMGAALIVGTMVGINQGQVTREVRLTTADVLANWQSAPPSVWAPYLLPPCVNVPSYCVLLRAAEHDLAADHMSIFSDPRSTQRLRAEGIVPGGVTARPLVVPPVLRAQMSSSGVARRAWDVLSTVYRSNPSFAQHYPWTDRGIRELLLWAISAGSGVTGQVILEYEWVLPVATGFFLHQYVSTYESWASVIDREQSLESRVSLELRR